ncbi:unnamed protein product [Colias eurytheme]|nr:unnamed protein product [Colias eurytheme]
MSFLSSLSQYVAGVADSVAGLALSPRRVPPSRHRSAEESQQQPQSSAATMRGTFYFHKLTKFIHAYRRYI